MDQPAITDAAAKRNLVILWIGCFLASCSFSLVMPFLPRFISELGVTENLYVWAGWTYAITFVSSAIMSPIWGNLADRYGRKPMIIRSGLSIATIYLLMSLVTGPYQLFGLRILNGVFSGFIPSSIALLGTNSREEKVGRYLAILQTGSASGQILGPMIGGLLADLLGIRPSMQVGSVLVLLGTLIVIWGVKERKLGLGKTKTSPIQDMSLAMHNKGLFALLISTMLVSLSLQSLEPILTEYVRTLAPTPLLEQVTGFLVGSNAEATVSGFIFALPAIATIFFAPRWANLGEKIGFPKLLAIGLLLAGLLAMPQALAKTTGMMVLLRFTYGIMTAAVQPAINAALAAAVDPSFRGRAFGINQSFSFVGAVLGPTGGGYIADYLGPRWVFVTTGALLMIASLWVYRRLATRLAAVQATH
ncbi:MAG TPA: MFS transporter [Symbiobacteriaceae bacterium]|nr:MFS transporter [Symbiobacteriaceae bacterium]